MMMITALTPDEIDALAFLIEKRRDLTQDADRWDRPGIAAALRKMHDVDPLAALAAGYAAAEDPHAETPAAITWPQYRHPALDTPATSPSRDPVCDWCNRTRPSCARAQRTSNDPHPFTTRSTAP